METVIGFIFSGPKITADGDRSHEIKRHLLFGRKIYDKLRQHIKKQRHLLCLLRKVCIIKAMVLPIVMYGYDSWTIKKAEHWRIDSFEMWCWKRLESPLDSKEIKPVYPKGNQFWVFIGKTDAEVGAPILWPSDVKNWLTGKDPYVKKYWGHEEKGQQTTRWLDGIIDAVDMRLGKLREIVNDRKAWHAAVHGVTKSWHGWTPEQQLDNMLREHK